MVPFRIEGTKGGKKDFKNLSLETCLVLDSVSGNKSFSVTGDNVNYSHPFYLRLNNINMSSSKYVFYSDLIDIDLEIIGQNYVSSSDSGVIVSNKNLTIDSINSVSL